jgi:hypothetical protein
MIVFGAHLTRKKEEMCFHFRQSSKWKHLFFSRARKAG